jgi:hypothetical protein|tara:strand:- start:254 stop:475 length:222 start_codon:yes stop_codon:yes gene_type:complete
MESVEEQVVTENMEEQDVQLPPGIKTEVVLSFLGNISQALTEISNGINQTITTIITEGTKPMEEEGETNEEQD